jgi:hypothetical protein
VQVSAESARTGGVDAPGEAERGDARAGHRVARDEQRRAPVDRLAQDAAIDRERADGVAVDGEEAAVDARHRRAAARHGAGPLEPGHAVVRKEPAEPPVERLAVDRQDVHAPGAALAGDRRPAYAGRHGDALALLVERARAERQVGGQGGAWRAGREQAEQDAGAPAHGPQGGRPADSP